MILDAIFIINVPNSSDVYADDSGENETQGFGVELQVSQKTCRTDD